MKPSELGDLLKRQIFGSDAEKEGQNVRLVLWKEPNLRDKPGLNIVERKREVFYMRSKGCILFS